MEFIFDITLLSREFANDYLEDDFPELMGKEDRPYSALLIDTHMDYYICIPFRSMIKHKNAFLFKTSKRSREKKSGLDYSKLVLINNQTYLGERAIIDRDEYKETSKNIKRIVDEVTQYINDYVNHKTGLTMLNERNYERRYKYSTLPYFHDVLKLKEE